MVRSGVQSMFGALRFLLAYFVVVSHLVGGQQFAYFGFYAVQGFFVLSGFIMTAALNDVYRFDAKRFWANRALRLLPLYYLIAALTLLAVILLPEQAGRFRAAWQGDIGAVAVALNFLVLPLQFSTPHFVLVPPYWSVAVEIVMYFMLWLVVARGEISAVNALGAAVAYHIACVYAGLDWDLRYMATPAALLPFSLGALVYFLKSRLALQPGWGIAGLALVCWILNFTLVDGLLSPGYEYGPGYYLGTLCFAVLVAGLANRRVPAMAKFDRVLGDLAYPVVLVHILAAFLVVAVAPGNLQGWSLLLAATPVMIAGAALMALAQERLIEPLRSQIRASRRGAAAPLAPALPPI
jgi:peptidoglycan/LPS O-acetylase OafA/YrhL